MMRRKHLECALLAAGIFSVGAPARAWYFPEHTELTRLALQDYAASFVTASLTKLVEEARAGGDGVVGYASLCPGVTTKLESAHAANGVTCVPYGALAALAGDHANYWYDLGESLRPHRSAEPAIWASRSFVRIPPAEREPLAVSLTDAARATWIDFQSSAPRYLVEVWTGAGSRLRTSPQVGARSGVNPRDYVRTLDAALFVLDPQYASRAKDAKTHFHDATASLADILDQSASGDFDNALAQLLVHHLKSLQLAVQARKAKVPRQQRELRNAALFEHAFALHFIEDGLAGGHVATDPAISVDEHRAQRHDYFNRQGLAVRRSLGSDPCDPFDDQLPSRQRSMGLSPCWVAHGDGFTTPVDRAYVAEAAARLQTSFALALDGRPPSLEERGESPEACKHWLKGTDEPELGCDLAWTAFLLDPFPEWSAHREREEPAGPGPWAWGIVNRHLIALEELARRDPIGCVNAGSPVAQPRMLPSGIFGEALLLEEPEQPEDPLFKDLGVVLVRPVLMAWPAAQTDVTTLAGGDIFHRGWQLQVAVNGAFSYSNPLRTSATTSVWVGVGGGLGYAAQGIFPTRVNRTLAEGNLGIAQGYYLAGSDVPFRSLGVIELRAPVTSFALYGAAALSRSRVPLELLGDKVTWGLLGARSYWKLAADGPVLTGWDAEVMNYYLGTPGSSDASLSGITASELRVRIGLRSRDFARLRSAFDGALFIAAELGSGYYTTLL